MPTLTEVVDLPGKDERPSAIAPAAPAPVAPVVPTAPPAPAASAATPIDEQALARRVMADLQRQLDLMLEVRLREALTPALARTADALVRDARQELTRALREAVDNAVRQATTPARERR